MKPEERTSTELSIETTDGWTLKVNEFVPLAGTIKAKAILIVMPAMGAHSRPYRFMASALSKSGNIVLTVDPRGHGESLPHPRRGIDYGFDDILHHDIPAVLKHAKTTHPDLPVFLVGHSLGGHLSTAYAAENSDDVAGLITLASPHVHYKKLAYPALIMMGLFIFLVRILGYLPGQHIGWGSPIARQQILDWARWGYGGTFRGTDGRTFEPLIKDIPIPCLCVGFTDDKFLARVKAVQHFVKMFPEDKVTHWSLSPEDLDVNILGHFDHLRTGATLWSRLDQWITEQL